MKRSILILLMLIGVLYSATVENYLKKFENLSPWQLDNLKFVAYNGKKYNLENTMVAIAMRESELGKYKLNMADPSAGLFHKLLPVYAEELGMKPTMWNMSRLAERLYDNRAEAMEVALCDFQKAYKHWRLVGCSPAVAWKRAVMSYNKGIAGWRKGKAYYKEIIKIIKAYRIWKRHSHS